jgi:hypothetical protein
MRAPLLIAVLTMSFVLAQPAWAETTETGSICVSPVPSTQPKTFAPDLFCRSSKLSFKIDSSAETPWPTKDSLKINGLELAPRHRVVVRCDGKPQQSFKFRFSSYKGHQLCMFINDLYQTVQLWDRAPWCKCQ